MGKMGNWSRLSAPSGTPLAFERRVSPALTTYLVAVHALALTPPLFLRFPALAVAIWLALVMASAVDAARRHVLRGSRGFVVGARWAQDGRWRLRTGDGGTWIAEARDALVTPWLCVIHWRAPVAGRRSLLVPADAVEPDTHRRLRRALLEALAGRRAEGAQPGRP